MDQICKEYNIEDGENKYLGLAYFLALDYHPIFKKKEKSNTSGKWTHGREALLVLEIESLIPTPNKRKKGIRKICKKLAESDEWALFLTEYFTEFGISDKNKSENIRKRYYAVRNKKEVKIKIKELLLLKDLLDDEIWKIIISTKN